MENEVIDSVYDMYTKHGSIAKLKRYINKRLRLYEMQMEPAEYIKKVFIDRDVYIDGFQLKEYDAFEQGYDAAFEEFTNGRESSNNS